jgi:hypothetical protein
MYKIPINLKIDKIIGGSISQWCIARHSICFNIGIVNFHVQSVISLENKNNTIAQWWGNQSLDAMFFDALDKKVVCYEIIHDVTLMIRFEGGIVLRIMDTSDQYESFVIIIKDGKVIIV